MASRNLRDLSLGFVLILLCLRHCSARKVLKVENLNKQEKTQPKRDVNVMPMPESGLNVSTHNNNDRTSVQAYGEIEIDSCGEGCEAPCFEQPCNHPHMHWVEGEYIPVPQPPTYIPTPAELQPQPPHLEPTPPRLVPQPPQVIPQPPREEYVAGHWEPDTSDCVPCEPWHGPGPCPCPCPEDAADENKEGVKTMGDLGHNDKPNKESKKQDSPLQLQEEKLQNDALSARTADAPMPAFADGPNVHA